MEKYGWLTKLDYQLLDGDVHVPESITELLILYRALSE